jgi:tetratricopeptide (TPR) repeat protein
VRTRKDARVRKINPFKELKNNSFWYRIYIKFGVLLLGLLLFLPLSALCQSGHQFEKMGDRSYSEEDYYGAAKYYHEALNFDSSQIELVKKYADALRGYNNYKVAEQYYDYLVSVDKEKKLPEALFWLGEIQKSNGKYNEAEESFKAFIALAPVKDYYYKKALQEVASCDFAMNLKKDTKLVAINAGTEINSKGSDFAAIYSARDNKLRFSSLRSGNPENYIVKDQKENRVRLFVSQWQEGSTWTFPVEEDSLLNNIAFDVANGCFSPDGKTFYFSACSKNICKIYVCRYLRGRWTRPSLLPPPINETTSSATQPFLANVFGNDVLLFVSDREGGYGKLDIWYSVLTGPSEYSEPTNAGAEINSPDNDICPFYDSDSTTLYFSSSWHYGFGGYDIFKSKGDLKKQGSAENMGVPFNSPANDLYYFIDADHRRAWFSSNRLGSMYGTAETCCNDIWYVQFPVEKKESLPVMIAVPDSLLPICLYFDNDSPGASSMDTVVEETCSQVLGEYLLHKERYIKALPEDDAKVMEDFFVKDAEQGLEKLESLEKFLADALARGETVRIGVKAFSSPSGSDRYNYYLRKRRLSSFMNDLLQYNGGELKKFLKSGVLAVTEVPEGGRGADDKPAVLAEARQRKIEVVSVKILD